MTPPPVQRADLRRWAAARVSGVLTEDAQLAPTLGAEPHALLILHFEAEGGLPYYARVDLGAHAADHMAARAELQHLRRGALVSVAGDALQVCRDHGREQLRVVRARDVVAFSDPIIKEPTP
jgi:hypothetical protein